MTKRSIRCAAPALLVALSVAPLSCSSSRAPYHPTATSAVLNVGRAQQEGVFSRDRWHPGIEVDRLRGAVIRITVDEDGSLSDGSGVAVCQIGTHAFILTAKHVLFPGTGDGSAKGRAPALSKAYRFELARSDIPVLRVGANDELWVKRSSEYDLAIVRLSVPDETIRLPPVSPGRGGDLPAGAPIHTFGYSAQSARGWDDVAGVVTTPGARLAFQPAVEPGFSGGPVFDAAGHLVGITLSTDANQQTRVLPIETAVAAVDRWLPPGCSRTR